MIKDKFTQIVKILKDKNLTISTMESCTGGGLASAITNVEGSSEVFGFGAVTYSNNFKVKMGVDAVVIDECSVYSYETAREMAKSIVVFANSDLGVGITGKLKAGDPNNPEGRDDVVYVCIFDKNKDRFYDDNLKVVYDTREKNKDMVIEKIADMLLSILK